MAAQGGCGSEERGAEVLRAEGQRVQTRAHALQEAPLPDGGVVDAGPVREQPAVAAQCADRVAGEQLRRPVPHSDTQVVRGVAYEAVGVDENKAGLGARSPRRHPQQVGGAASAVHGHALLRVEDGGTPLGTTDSLCYHRFRAGTAALLPQVDDPTPQRNRLVVGLLGQAGRLPGDPKRVGQRDELPFRRQPGPVCRRTQDLQQPA